MSFAEKDSSKSTSLFFPERVCLVVRVLAVIEDYGLHGTRSLSKLAGCAMSFRKCNGL